MAIPAPTLVNLSGAIFLLAAETGQIVQSLNCNSTVQEEIVYDASVGYDIGSAFFNYEQTGTLEGLYTAASGPGAATPGATITLGNSINFNGFSSGGVYALSIARNHSAKGFTMVTTNWRRKAGFT